MAKSEALDHGGVLDIEDWTLVLPRKSSPRDRALPTDGDILAAKCSALDDLYLRTYGSSRCGATETEGYVL